VKAAKVDARDRVTVVDLRVPFSTATRVSCSGPKPRRGVHSPSRPNDPRMAHIADRMNGVANDGYGNNHPLMNFSGEFSGLVRRGKKEGGTKSCWDERNGAKKIGWWIPFSMWPEDDTSTIPQRAAPPDNFKWDGKMSSILTKIT